MTVSRVLIAESLLVGSPLDTVTLTVEKVSRADVGDVAASQPRTWTFIHFETPVDQAPILAQSLSAVLDPAPGWYCDFRSPEETFVVFSGRVFRYPRGDPRRRAEAESHGRSVGVPEAQLDWPE